MAERQYLKVIEQNPEFAPAHDMLADFYLFESTQLTKALAHSLKAIELDPGNIEFKGRLTSIYRELDDLNAANSMLEQMADLDSDHEQVGNSELWINLYKGNDAGAREAINWLLPKIQEHKFWAQDMGAIELLMGDTQRAREIYLSVAPEWMDVEHWPDLMSKYKYSGCIVSWILINTGDEETGRQLLQEATAFYDERLALVIEHVDLQGPELCYLTAGDTARALEIIESKLEHNHLAFWETAHRLPMFDLIRHEPRYLAVMEEREKRIAEQRNAYERGQP